MDENGPSTSGGYKKGDRVVAVPWPAQTTGQGTWQQYVAVPEKDLVRAVHSLPCMHACCFAGCCSCPCLSPGMTVQVRVPDEVDDKAASQFLVNPVTGPPQSCRRPPQDVPGRECDSMSHESYLHACSVWPGGGPGRAGGQVADAGAAPTSLPSACTFQTSLPAFP